MDEGIAIPILLGNEAAITQPDQAASACSSMASRSSTRAARRWRAKRNEYGDLFFEKRSRRGYNFYEARKVMRDRVHFRLHDGGDMARPMP